MLILEYSLFLWEAQEWNPVSHFLFIFRENNLFLWYAF